SPPATGRSCPCWTARSMAAAGRTPPSRWSWSTTLGRSRYASASVIAGSRSARCVSPAGERRVRWMGRRHFSTATFDFLQDLELFNERPWFEANRQRYEADVREPLLELIDDLAEPMHERVSPHIVCDPRKVGGSMFRIHRDTRFSKDKSPYKTAAAAFFRHDVGREHPAPGVYLHLEPGNSMVGVGLYHPPPDALRTIREAVVADPDGWTASTTMVGPRSWEFKGETLTRAPRGF